MRVKHMKTRDLEGIESEGKRAIMRVCHHPSRKDPEIIIAPHMASTRPRALISKSHEGGVVHNLCRALSVE